MSTTTTTQNLILMCRDGASALAAADKAVADAQAAAAALRTRLSACPALTTASITTVPAGAITFEPATGTITRNGTGDAKIFAQSKDPIPILANSFVMFSLTGPKALGYNFRIGLTETPNMSQWNNANGKNTGLFFNFFTDMRIPISTDPKQFGRTFLAGYRGGDGEPNFIRFATPINTTPVTTISASHMPINNDTSTFILHFDGRVFNMYHNGRKVHTMAPQVAPVATAKYFVWMYAEVTTALPTLRIRNLLFGNATLADIEGFTRTLPQTGGRRRRAVTSVKKRRGGSKKRSSRTYRN